MALVDDLRAVYDALDELPGGLGARDFAVTVRVEQMSGDIEDGATVVGVAVPDLTITPPPSVARVTLGDGSWFGSGAVVPDAGGPVTLAVYRVDVSRAYAAQGGGGYTQAQLAPKPAAGTNQRVVYVLTGPGLNPAGERFRLIDAVLDGLYEHSLLVQRAPDLD